MLPKLQPGVSRRVHFTTIEWIGPEQAYIANLLSADNAEKKAVHGAVVWMKLHGVDKGPTTPITDAASSTDLARTLLQLDERLANVPGQLRITVLVVLHDGTVVPFRWKNDRFDKDFFTGGVTPA